MLALRGRSPANWQTEPAHAQSKGEEIETSYTVAQTLSKANAGVLTTPPSTWYAQWKQRNRYRPDTRNGYLDMQATNSEHELLVGGFEVIQDWERPLMRALAEEAARNHGHVLEVGFGMGVCATYLVEAGASGTSSSRIRRCWRGPELGTEANYPGRGCRRILARPHR